jgi:hypothetical protein
LPLASSGSHFNVLPNCDCIVIQSCWIFQPPHRVNSWTPQQDQNVCTAWKKYAIFSKSCFGGSVRRCSSSLYSNRQFHLPPSKTKTFKCNFNGFNYSVFIHAYNVFQSYSAPVTLSLSILVPPTQQFLFTFVSFFPSFLKV